MDAGEGSVSVEPPSVTWWRPWELTASRRRRRYENLHPVAQSRSERCLNGSWTTFRHDNSRATHNDRRKLPSVFHARRVRQQRSRPVVDVSVAYRQSSADLTTCLCRLVLIAQAVFLLQHADRWRHTNTQTHRRKTQPHARRAADDVTFHSLCLLPPSLPPPSTTYASLSRLHCRWIMQCDAGSSWSDRRRVETYHYRQFTRRDTTPQHGSTTRGRTC